MRIKKAILTITTVVAIVAPLVPKTVNVNITMEEPRMASSKPFKIIKSQCNLTESRTEDNRQICKYRCKDGDGIEIAKVYYNGHAFCASTITENVKKTER